MWDDVTLFPFSREVEMVSGCESKLDKFRFHFNTQGYVVFEVESKDANEAAKILAGAIEDGDSDDFILESDTKDLVINGFNRDDIINRVLSHLDN